VNGLGTVMCFLATCVAGDSGLSAAEVFGARQFVARVVDHFIGLQFGRRVGTEPKYLPRKNDNNEEQERLQQQRSEHSPVWEETMRSLTCQART
jgi:hypothetical protein